MTEYNKLINDVNNGKFSPVYLIHGEEIISLIIL